MTRDTEKVESRGRSGFSTFRDEVNEREPVRDTEYHTEKEEDRKVAHGGAS